MQLGEGVIDTMQQIAPSIANLDQHLFGSRRPITQHVRLRERVKLGVARFVELQIATQIFFKCIDEAQFVRDRQFDVDALDGVGVVAEARERDHDVLVNFEGVGVFGDSGGARTIQPELLAGIGADGNETLATACVRDANDF